MTAPKNAIEKAAAKRGLIPNLIKTTPAPSLAIISATAEVYELTKMSPYKYFISKLTSVYVKPKAYQVRVIINRL